MTESDTRQICLLWWRPQRTDLTHIAIFPKEKAFVTCGLSGSFYPFSDHASHMETGWQKV